MPHTASDTLDKPDGRVTPSSASISHDASKTIIQAICSGRSIVGVVAAAGTATSAVVVAALDDLASRKTRIIRMGPAMVSCLGPASAMDHLRVSEMQINGGNGERSKQIVQGLQILGQPIPGETRRLLVIEEAESVDPELLENLARMPGLATPVLPLQLLYVGGSAYWDSLVAFKDGAARRLIGSPMILLQAPVEAVPVAPSPVARAKIEPVVVTRTTPEKVRRPRWLFAGLGVLGVGSLLGIGLANQARLASFLEAFHTRVRDVTEAPTRTVGTADPLSGTSQAEAGRPASSGSKAPETDGKSVAIQLDPTERAAIPDVAASMTAKSIEPVPQDANHAPPAQAANLHPELPTATPDPAAAARTISTSMSRGDAMLALHDLSAARRYYELAATAGSAEAALALGRTYDPTSLVRSGAVSAQPDATLAYDWYRKAATLGSSEAEGALRNLGHQQPN